ncbi:hypothetical protein OSB04_005583 [Centaurea solstitialis]|uniref:Uncharacterized protein n=1 Tax=Centaurea solstitialis TaxID=347529 RepID=A0AA38U104_9ASTR|nr:hypothetical protein OSB04_005583 [Centaurea solstitialis]
MDSEKDPKTGEVRIGKGFGKREVRTGNGSEKDMEMEQVEEAEGKLDSLIQHENEKREETAEDAKNKEGQEITAQDQENDK